MWNNSSGRYLSTNHSSVFRKFNQSAASITYQPGPPAASPCLVSEVDSHCAGAASRFHLLRNTDPWTQTMPANQSEISIVKKIQPIKDQYFILYQPIRDQNLPLDPVDPADQNKSRPAPSVPTSGTSSSLCGSLQGPIRDQYCSMSTNQKWVLPAACIMALL